jgi:hypothetical protein
MPQEHLEELQELAQVVGQMSKGLEKVFHLLTIGTTWRSR